MRRHIEDELLQSDSGPLSAEVLIRSVKSRFIGESSRVSPRRTELQNFGALATAKMSLQELLPSSEPMVESQIAVVLFPQIEELGRQLDAAAAQDGITPTQIAQVVDAVQAEQYFRIPERWKGVAAIILAMLLLLTTVTAACGAGDSTAPDAGQLTGQPTFFVDVPPQPPVLGGGEGETPAPAEITAVQSCVFDSARNLRTGPSATAAKTTLDGSGTTVAGKEYECIETVTNADKSVWVRISELPDVWAVLVLPGSGLTGTLKARETAVTASVEAQTPISTTAALTANQELTNTAHITATGTIGLPSPDAPVVGQIEQGVVLSPEEYTRALFPANFEEYFAQQGKDVVFDEKYNIFFSVDMKTKTRLALFPHAAANDTEQDLARAESFFDPKQSCLSDAEVSTFNPDGRTRQVCMFVNTQHPIIDGHIYFHPDLLKNQKELLSIIAKYIYDGDEDRMNSEDFVLYVNLAAEEDDTYQPRDFEDMDPANTASKYVEWGFNGIVRPGEPLYRLEKITTGPGKPDIIIMTAFQEMSDLPSIVTPQQLPLLQWIVPYKPFDLALMYLRSIEIRRTSAGVKDEQIKDIGECIARLKTDKNASLGGSKAKPNYLATLAAMGQ